MWTREPSRPHSLSFFIDLNPQCRPRHTCGGKNVRNSVFPKWFVRRGSQKFMHHEDLDRVFWALECWCWKWGSISYRLPHMSLMHTILGLVLCLGMDTKKNERRYAHKPSRPHSPLFFLFCSQVVGLCGHSVFRSALQGDPAVCNQSHVCSLVFT